MLLMFIFYRENRLLTIVITVYQTSVTLPLAPTPPSQLSISSDPPPPPPGLTPGLGAVPPLPPGYVPMPPAPPTP